jgi:hypothetical protein
MVDERPGRAGQRRARSNAAATRRGEVRRRTAATALKVNAAGRAERATTQPRRAGTRLAGDGTLLLRRRGCAKEQGEGARGLHAGAPACCVLRFATAGKQPHAGPAGREAGQRQGEARRHGCYGEEGWGKERREFLTYAAELRRRHSAGEEGERGREGELTSAARTTTAAAGRGGETRCAATTRRRRRHSGRDAAATARRRARSWARKTEHSGEEKTVQRAVSSLEFRTGGSI